MSALEARIVRALGAKGAPLDDVPAWRDSDDDSDGWASDGGGAHCDEDEEEVVEVDEADVMALLDAAEPPLQVCRRLFLPPPPPEALQVLPAWAAAALHRDGWAVLPRFLDAATAAAAREEALALHRAGAFGAAPAHESFTDAAARGDTVLWLHAPSADATAGATPPALRAAMTALDALREDLGRVLALRLGRAEHQLAVYPPCGAAYARHRDAFPDDGGEAAQRRVTAVLYANVEDWDTATHGGALRLHVPPPPACATGEADEHAAAAAAAAAACCTAGPSWVDVAPRGGALVLFLSGAVDHEVLPCHAHRVALTAWCQ